MKQIKLLIIAVFSSIVTYAQQAESTVKAVDAPSINYTVVDVVTELNIPWGMAFLPEGGILIAEKASELIYFNKGVKTNVEGLPEIYVRGQGGFMDLELHPNYEDNGWIYFTFASSEGEGDGGFTAIMRAKLDGASLVQKELLYKGGPNTKKGQHFGSRIEFDNDGYLYFSIGDRGNRDENPQDITRDGGKIYRLHDDGKIPVDNPFVGKEGAKSAIYSYGHRNPQGLVKHYETGEIWEHEHGPKGGDEINIIQKGKNFGWPIISYGVNYNGTSFTSKTANPGMEQPFFFWAPSIAPSGMTFVTSDVYPDWKGNLLVGSLKFKYIERLVIDGGKVVKREIILKDLGRVRNVRQGPDGFIYVALEGKGIVKIVPNK
jgi:glucose/arabinose dehydrogenase